MIKTVNYVSCDYNLHFYLKLRNSHIFFWYFETVEWMI